MKKLLTTLALATAILFTGCTRIETGEVGLRKTFSKQIETTELLPGSWNQTLIGDVITFPVKDIALSIENKKPLTADNTALDDLDVLVVYNINPTSVAEIYSSKSRAFHAVQGSDTYLMYMYLETVANNAIYKAARKFKALEVADKRLELEADIQSAMQASLAEEKLDKSVTISKIQVKSIVPNQQILQAATNYVKAQNELAIKTTEVQIAQKESERMAALSANSEQSIKFMNAQAQMKIAEGIAAGKVNTIVVPMDFKGMVNVTPK